MHFTKFSCLSQSPSPPPGSSLLLSLPPHPSSPAYESRRKLSTRTFASLVSGWRSWCHAGSRRVPVHHFRVTLSSPPMSSVPESGYGRFSFGLIHLLFRAALYVASWWLRSPSKDPLIKVLSFREDEFASRPAWRWAGGSWVEAAADAPA